MITLIIILLFTVALLLSAYAGYMKGYDEGAKAEKARAVRIIRDAKAMCEDLEYFKNKLNNATDPIQREKIQKTIDLLEDAFIIHRLYSETK